ncbi:ABC transporter substrate-binding protein [Chromobacterium violaceum]|uniref:ABC transporter substrate-binding protein n=1 Tax=Chromobacterium violaceum TaxID=536 RepID=UPI0009DB1DFC|nr:extracellular solute-binding protein [Chromobacterium violaceum]OQS45169.1 sugar ABC transporter substrate-binding protein [Chromobacterium violaceum]OQS46679.1 sugar ABC transporter substrate-binding protein [Chromobacterium violaceum]QRO33514.1 extracellular solute-binding protein [Chromobacterium violaceum]QRQ16682.1 extracellular solute-binding protein [Chromobacterium violaceum]
MKPFRPALAALALLACSLSAHAEKVRLEFWTDSLKPTFDGYFANAKKTYEAQHPDVEVQWVDVFNDNFETKLNAAIAAGRPPALVNHDVPRLFKYAQKGTLIPLDAALGADRAAYLPNALADLSFGGKLYGLPWYNNINVLVINGELFKKAGLDPKQPVASLDEELRLAKIVKAKTGVPGLLPQLGQIDGIMLGQGLPLIQNGKAVFNSPRHAALIRKFADAYKAGALARDSLFADDNYQASIKLYNSGRLAMMETAPTSAQRTQSDARNIYAATVVQPAPLGPTKIAQGGYLFSWSVSKGLPARTQQEAVKFARFLTGDAQQLAFAKVTGATFPSTRQALADSYFVKTSAGGGAVESSRIEGAKVARNIRTLVLTGVPNVGDLKKNLVDNVEAAVTGKKDAQKALDDAAAFWNRQLK